MAKLTPEDQERIDNQGTILPRDPLDSDGGESIPAPGPTETVPTGPVPYFPPQEPIEPSPTSPTAPIPAPTTTTPLPVITLNWLKTVYAGNPLKQSILSILSSAPLSSAYTVEPVLYSSPSNRTYVYEKDINFVGGQYQFDVTVNDGIRIYVDSRLIFESWKSQSETTYSKQFTEIAGMHRVKFIYFNGDGDGSVRVHLKLIAPSTTPPAPIPTTPSTPTSPTTPTTDEPTAPPPPTTTPPPAPPNVVDLRDIIKFSVDKTSVNYVKGSMKAIEPYNLGIKNISDAIDVQLTFKGISGIGFSPASLELKRGQSTTVKVTFNVSQINNLPEGLNVANTIVHLSANNVVAGTSTIPAPAGPAGGTEWYNATTGVYTQSLPTGATICPPGSRTYYLADDPKLQTCLKSYSDSPTMDPVALPGSGGTVVIPEGATSDSPIIIYKKKSDPINPKEPL